MECQQRSGRGESCCIRTSPVVSGDRDIASAFVAAGRENIVGGDFFDVFQSADDVWTAILGDVSGKGARAASITSAARHTLRTAAAVTELRSRGVVLEEYDMPGLSTVNGIAEIEGQYPIKGRAERGAWLHASEGNLLAVGQVLP